MTDREIYLERAAAARAEAEVATLDNVRERCLRSEAAWAEMAERAARTERMRATLQAEKAAAGQPQLTNTRNLKNNATSELQILAQAQGPGAAT